MFCCCIPPDLGIAYRYRQNIFTRHTNQIYLLIAFMSYKKHLAVLRIPHLAKLLPMELSWFLIIYFAILCHFFMIMLTLDRFLVFYFTIKYPIYCTSEKPLKTLYIVVALTLIVDFACSISVYSNRFLDARFYSAICNDCLRYSLLYWRSIDIHIHFCGL